MIIGFTDEYGNNSFEFETQGSHFIVTTILVKRNEEVKELEKKV